MFQIKRISQIFIRRRRRAVHTFDGRVTFFASTIEFGRELWSTDGTSVGTQFLVSIGVQEKIEHDRPVVGPKRRAGAKDGRVPAITTSQLVMGGTIRDRLTVRRIRHSIGVKKIEISEYYDFESSRPASGAV